jgi:hypothetical protein
MWLTGSERMKIKYRTLEDLAKACREPARHKRFRKWTLSRSVRKNETEIK